MLKGRHPHRVTSGRVSQNTPDSLSTRLEDYCVEVSAETEGSRWMSLLRYRLRRPSIWSPRKKNKNKTKSTYTHARARARTHTHSRYTHARTHAHTHTHTCHKEREICTECCKSASCAEEKKKRKKTWCVGGRNATILIMDFAFLPTGW